MSTDLILVTLALVILDVSFSLYASFSKPPTTSSDTEEEVDDLPFGPVPFNQD